MPDLVGEDEGVVFRQVSVDRSFRVEPGMVLAVQAEVIRVVVSAKIGPDLKIKLEPRG